MKFFIPTKDLFLLIAFVVEVNLLLGSVLGTISCGIGFHYLSWDNHCSYMG
jgi:hypothetical protein